MIPKDAHIYVYSWRALRVFILVFSSWVRVFYDCILSLVLVNPVSRFRLVWSSYLGYAYLTHKLNGSHF